MPTLIGNIDKQPTTVRPGETVRIEVFDTEGSSFKGTKTQVLINGVPGAVQFLQFPTKGERRLFVVVRTVSGETDHQVALLDVEGEALEFPSSQNQPTIAMMGVTQLPTQPYSAVITVGSFIDSRSSHLLRASVGEFIRQESPLIQQALDGRIAREGILGRIMTENPQSLMRIEHQRFAHNPSSDGVERLTNPRIRPQVATSRPTAMVYDLTAIDIHRLISREIESNKPVYEWDFGDGSTAVTNSPLVSHDFFAAIDHEAGLGQFTVTCHIKHADITVRRTLTIHSAYAICKRVGTVVPHVTSDQFAQKKHNRLSGILTVYNVETKPIILDNLSITPLSDNGDDLALPGKPTRLGTPITLPPQSATMVRVNVPFVNGQPNRGELRFDVKGFSVLYTGTMENYPVRCSAFFEVPATEWKQKPKANSADSVQEQQSWPWLAVEQAVNRVNDVGREHIALDTTTGTLTVNIGTRSSGNSLTLDRDEAINVLSSVYTPLDNIVLQAHQRNVPPDRFTQLERPAIPHRLNGPPVVVPVAEGSECDPDNLTQEEQDTAYADQLVCQLTQEEQEVTTPARWINARKGDIILSPGGDGFIGGLMMNVSPPQWYSHCGIMTRNYDEITHSTGSKDRLLDHKIGFQGGDGFDPKILKYTWPGAITQTVQNSQEGESFPDPEFDKSYTINAFGKHAVGFTHNDRFVLIPPLVIKPDPNQETTTTRSILHAIAADARRNAGRPGVQSKFHYRWYCYTDPMVGLGAPEGPEAGWAAGTHASVCSSFIWLLAKARHAHLETSQALVTPTDLEPGDVVSAGNPVITPGGAFVRPLTPDGLYTYSAEERLNAANWLYNFIYNEVFDKAGWLGNFITDAADDVANQILNAFANDDADGRDSTAWQNVTEADAVSPDNMLWWDSPAQGGLYGYAEPALYREPRKETYTISKWKRVLNRGNVHGRVLGETGPIAEAMVQVYDGKTTFSDADGNFALNDIPLGDYLLKGSAVFDGILYSGQLPVSLNVANQVIDIKLLPPPDRYRKAQVYVDFWGRDSESIGSDEIHDPAPAYFELELGPDRLVNSHGFNYHWGGELRVEYTITFRLLLNNTIEVQLQAKLFDGTSENNQDLDGQDGLTFQVGDGQTIGTILSVTNTAERANDEGKLAISVKNIRNSN